MRQGRCIRSAFGAMLMLAVLLLAPHHAAAEQRIALVIGNGSYGPALGRLSNPPNDARLMGKQLASLGFRVTVVIDGDQKKMKRAIAEFGRHLNEAGSDAVGLFFYAGHGVQVDGENFLVPISAEIDAEADVDLEAVSAETVLRQMEYADARVSIIILDACRNNPLPRGKRSASGGLARMDAPAGSFIGYSTSPGNVAADGEGANSPYTTALAAEIVKPGAAIEEVFRNVRVRVMEITSAQQVPWESSSLTGAFYFRPGTLAAAGTAPAPQKETGGSAEPEASETERLFWQSIRESSDPAEFESYLSRYPDGTFADLARAKLVRLTPAAAASEARSAEPTAPTEPVAEAPAAAATAAAPQTDGGQPTLEAALTPPPVINAGEGLVLSSDVARQMQAYLRKLRNRNGAFAVSPDGKSAGAFICDAVDLCVPGRKQAPENNDRSYPQRQALHKCSGVAGQECVLLLIRDQERRSYSLQAP